MKLKGKYFKDTDKRDGGFYIVRMISDTEGKVIFASEKMKHMRDCIRDVDFLFNKGEHEIPINTENYKIKEIPEKEVLAWMI
jgi:hypothetical protein